MQNLGVLDRRQSLSDAGHSAFVGVEHIQRTFQGAVEERQMRKQSRLQLCISILVIGLVQMWIDHVDEVLKERANPGGNDIELITFTTT